MRLTASPGTRVSRGWNVVPGLRYHRPDLARWVNRDPIEELGGVNQTCFVSNRPSGVVDVLGLQEACCKMGLEERLSFNNFMYTVQLNLAGATEQTPETRSEAFKNALWAFLNFEPDGDKTLIEQLSDHDAIYSSVRSQDLPKSIAVTLAVLTKYTMVENLRKEKLKEEGHKIGYKDNVIGHCNTACNAARDLRDRGGIKLCGLLNEMFDHLTRIDNPGFDQGQITADAAGVDVCADAPGETCEECCDRVVSKYWRDKRGE